MQRNSPKYSRTSLSQMKLGICLASFDFLGVLNLRQENWMGWQDSNLRMTESKSVVLPLDDTPIEKLSRKAMRETQVYGNW